MIGTLTKLLSSIRVWILLISLVIAIFAVNPTFDTSGVAIRAVSQGSAAADSGIVGPAQDTALRQLERILTINSEQVNDLATFYKLTNDIEPGDTLVIETNRDIYSISIEPVYNTTIVGYQNITRVENGTNVTILEPIEEQKVVGVSPLGLSVSTVAGSNVRLGLDLEGGTRVLIEPDINESAGETKLTAQQFETLRENLEQRLNVFGLSDIRLSIIRDSPTALGGEPTFILIEIAGANIEDVERLVSQQGKFEAKIGNETVFTGENKDIVYVAHSAAESGIGPQPCGQAPSGEWVCSYFFGVTLSADAARRVADVTNELNIITDPETGSRQLDQPIEFFLDDVLTNSLSIDADLRGSPQTRIQITGTGIGTTEFEAVEAAKQDMRNLQAVIETGSLPSKITVVKADTISPMLGDEFLSNAVLVAVAALLSVGVVVFIRYRKLIVSIPMVLTAGSEILLVLGVAAFINWQMDLPAIAGLIIIIGTSVDHQIVITDELLQRRGRSVASFRTRFKQAFFIIIAAYLTTVVAMLPLMFAGAGLLKNFALTTVIGITVGVLITRPAYGKVLEILLRRKDND